MIEFLLVIIAIGVLLMSDTGSVLLSTLSGLAIIVEILFLAFWAIIFLGGIFGFTLSLVWHVMPFALFIFVVFTVLALIQKKDNHKESHGGKINKMNKWLDDSWLKSKWQFCFAVISIIAVSATILWTIFK